MTRARCLIRARNDLWARQALLNAYGEQPLTPEQLTRTFHELLLLHTLTDPDLMSADS